MDKRLRGMTLPEILIVVAFIAVVFAAILGLSISSAKLYARTRPQTNGQLELMLALNKMSQNLREGMNIRQPLDASGNPIPSLTGSRVEIWIPKEKALPGEEGKSSGIIDPTSEEYATGYFREIRQEGQHICYFLGRQDPNDPNSQQHKNRKAFPDVNGDTIFRVYKGTPTDLTPGDIMTTDGVLAAFYDGAEVIVENILPKAYVTDQENPTTEIETPIFEVVSNYADAAKTSATAQSVTISVTRAVPVRSPSGTSTENLTLSTQFCLRNYEEMK